MTATLLTGIAELATNDPAREGVLGLVTDAAVVVEVGSVVDGEQPELAGQPHPRPGAELVGVQPAP